MTRYVEGDILSMNLKSLGTQYTAILMDPPLMLPGEDHPEQHQVPTKGKLALKQFVSISMYSANFSFGIVRSSEILIGLCSIYV